jgi:hypothetical protein
MGMRGWKEIGNAEGIEGDVGMGRGNGEEERERELDE